MRGCSLGASSWILQAAIINHRTVWVGSSPSLPLHLPQDQLGTHLSLLLQDYIFTEGELVFQPGETRKEVQVPLLELTEIDTLLNSCQLKQFAVDLLHPKYGAKIGRYPQTTVTIADPGACDRVTAVTQGSGSGRSPRCRAWFCPRPNSSH